MALGRLLFLCFKFRCLDFIYLNNINSCVKKTSEIVRDSINVEKTYSIHEISKLVGLEIQKNPKQREKFKHPSFLGRVQWFNR